MIQSKCSGLWKREQAAKRKRNEPELAFQKSVKGFLDLALPKWIFWTSFPAGGGGAKRGAQLKASGLVSGVPDILVIFEGHSIFLELKAGKNTLTPAQKVTIPRLIESGASVHLCRTLEDVARDLSDCGIPLKASIPGAWTARNTKQRVAA